MSASGEFSVRDLYGLQCYLRDFDLLMNRSRQEPDDLAVRYSVIKAFELTYEMSMKTLTRYLVERSTRGSEVASFDFHDVIRLADQENIIQSGWPQWKFYRQNRNRTAHMYRAETALAVTAILPNFLADAHALLTNLSRRVDHHD